MRIEVPGSDSRLPRGIINLQEHCSSSGIMDVRSRNVSMATNTKKNSSTNHHHHHHYHPHVIGEKKFELHRTLSSQGSGKRLIPASYFSLESLVLLICLTASLLILPLILPPLPPPPLMLLLVPIGILVVLMILAFMPSNVRDITYAYV
ncbi:Auxin-regulatedinvolved in organ size [Tripterygium wilfordii]|uniref:Auxin-regulatedinvolved in organ size n=1 Tax=Tripterygium wilfordii TaxID=458696 RepID=A0A7J7CIR6_TRIWF|nr:ARGOS-like protein [Tripterygium wilfordii]KAF5733958.1 Auxin-regulatedinvolved in organ size [Tripterygium wilfordii]